jgi:hypothetical protein
MIRPLRKAPPRPTRCWRTYWRMLAQILRRRCSDPTSSLAHWRTDFGWRTYWRMLAQHTPTLASRKGGLGPLLPGGSASASKNIRTSVRELKRPRMACCARRLRTRAPARPRPGPAHPGMLAPLFPRRVSRLPRIRDQGRAAAPAPLHGSEPGSPVFRWTADI